MLIVTLKNCMFHPLCVWLMVVNKIDKLHHFIVDGCEFRSSELSVKLLNVEIGKKHLFKHINAISSIQP